MDVNVKTMTASKQFKFVDQSCDYSLEIIIPEVVNPQYGLFTWPSSPVLAQYIFYNRKNFENKKILELGAGTALPGVVASKIGATHVYLSDAEEYSNCLQNCSQSCKVNDLANVDVIPITWGKVSTPLIKLNCIDYIIASDCFYDKKDFQNILFTIAFLLDKNQGASFIFSYQVRDESLSIEELLAHWELVAEEIPLASFHGDVINENNNMSPDHLIQLFCVKKSTNK